jgi:hypothetical protein
VCQSFLILSSRLAVFDQKTTSGFEHHIKHDHYSWNFLFLYCHLLLKPKTELTGVEEFLYRKCMVGDFSFLPLHRSLALSDTGSSKRSASKPVDDDEARKEEHAALQLRALTAEVAALRALVVETNTATAAAAAAAAGNARSRRSTVVKPPLQFKSTSDA